MKEISAYRENRRTFPGLDDYRSGQQWFLRQPQSAWSRTELLIENCLPAKRSDQGIQQQHVTKCNTEYQLLVLVVPSSPARLDEPGWCSSKYSLKSFKEHLLARIRNCHDLTCHLNISCQWRVFLLWHTAVMSATFFSDGAGWARRLLFWYNSKGFAV